MFGKKTIRSRAYAKKHQKRSKTFLIVSFFVLIFLLIGAWWLTSKSFLVIKEIEVLGNKAVSTEEIKSIVLKKIEKKIFIFKINNFIFLPRKEIRQEIGDSFDWIKDVDISTKGFSTLIIDISEYDPEFIFCDEGVENNCFLSDQTGFIFAKALFLNGNDYLVFESKLPSKIIGERVIAKGELQKINQFVEALKSNNLEVKKIRLKDLNEVRFKLKEGTEIIIDLNNNLDEMLGHFLLLLAEETNKHKSRDAFLNSTEYIDIRFGNKVFYKPYEE